MEKIILVLLGIFVGMAITGYMSISEIQRKERKIKNQKHLISTKDEIIATQTDTLSKIKIAVNKRYYTIDRLENDIKKILSKK